MKTKNILMFAACILLFGSLINSCDGAKDEKDEKPNNQSEIHDNIDEEYLRDMDDYRFQTDAEFAANDSIIADYRLKIKDKPAKEREEIEGKIADLERRNNEMRTKIRDYKAEDKTKWEQFKEEFKHDMNELGQAFKDLVVDNEK